MSSGAVIVSIDSSFILVLRSSCASSQTVDAALLLLGNLFMVNVLELEVLFDVNLLDRGLLDCCAAMILRTSHCTFDLGNFRILNCTFSRVLSFPSVILNFLRVSSFLNGVILSKFTSRSCVISFAILSR